jgi:hypothetical protein
MANLTFPNSSRNNEAQEPTAIQKLNVMISADEVSSNKPGNIFAKWQKVTVSIETLHRTKQVVVS